MSIISEALVKQSQKLAMTAKDGIVVIGNDTYELKFNHYEWVYEVSHKENGEQVARFNTKKLSQAKAWAKEWFSN